MQFNLPNELTIRACGTDWKFDASGISNDTACQLVLQGLAVICQRANAGNSEISATNTLADQHGRVREKLNAIAANTYNFGSGGGGKRLTDLEREVRVIAEQELVAVVAYKLVDARKIVTDNVVRAAEEILNRKRIVANKEFSTQEMMALVQKKVTSWESAAKAAIAARAAATSGDEDLDLS
jgi:hypothetical protein